MVETLTCIKGRFAQPALRAEHGGGNVRLSEPKLGSATNVVADGPERHVEFVGKLFRARHHAPLERAEKTAT
jgi:hypothetical protein